ncbi:MAG TPA: hypothetical protein VEY89_09745 [Candidatus Dormibacteraeota bacterium]|nr:hypothetical protein [Candidatus Dormibacteraeota bacterium]
MQIVTVAAERSSTFSMSDMAILVGSAIVIAVLAGLVLARLRRSRQQRHA